MASSTACCLAGDSVEEGDTDAVGLVLAEADAEAAREQAAAADDLPRLVEADLRFHDIVISSSGQTHTGGK